MGLRASAASLLLSVVVAAPCMRKNFCMPSEPPMPGPARQQPQQPVSPIKPAVGVPAPGHPCTGHSNMHAKAGHAVHPMNMAGHSS
jgi:hypothetical protein